MGKAPYHGMPVPFRWAQRGWCQYRPSVYAVNAISRDTGNYTPLITYPGASGFIGSGILIGSQSL